jgi:galactokinase
MDDLPAFLRLVNESGASSALSLQNIHTGDPNQQSLALALALGRDLLGGDGAIRVHGGGFAGTVQAFVPTDILPRFKEGMESVFGAGSCQCLHFRTAGTCILAGG